MDLEIAWPVFAHSPFPCDRPLPGHDTPFFDVEREGRRGHTNRDGHVYWEDETYTERRVLLAIPSDFDVRRAPTIVLFLHGNECVLERDVVQRQRVPAQVAQAGINAVLVAPQFALDARDSSPGAFSRPGYAAAFLREASTHIERLLWRRGPAHRCRVDFTRADVIVVAYSGGYLPAACLLRVGGVAARVRGVFLLDALYDHVAVFANWLRSRRGFLVSAHGAGTATLHDELHALLRARDVHVETQLPPRLARDAAVLLDLEPGFNHRDAVAKAWCADPVADLLQRAGAADRR